MEIWAVQKEDEVTLYKNEFDAYLDIHNNTIFGRAARVGKYIHVYVLKAGDRCDVLLFSKTYLPLDTPKPDKPELVKIVNTLFNAVRS